MVETFVTILTAHLLGDFIFQTNRMVEHKKNISVLLLHVTIVTLLSGLLIGTIHWPVLLSIFLIHFIMDIVKVYRMSDTLIPFLIDQGVHVIVLSGLAVLFSDVATQGLWVTRFNVEIYKYYFASLCIISGIILIVPAGGILIGKVTHRFMKEIGDHDIKGLEKGGLYIGCLERSLVMLLLFINQPTGIGFLFAAKSILRFGEIQNQKQRKVAEYVIIGTFLSFGWALLISVITQKAVQYWM